MSGLATMLLAAGGSRRLGRCKQLVEIDGLPLVRRAVDLLLGLEPQITVVVTGANAAEVSAPLRGLSLRIAHNPDWQTGMAASIAAGANCLDDDADGVLIALCDQWRLDPGDLNALRIAWEARPRQIAAARWRKVFGPPAIFPRRLFDRLRTLTGEAGARALISEHLGSVEFVAIENAGWDLDTPADLAAIEGCGPPHSNGI